MTGTTYEIWSPKGDMIGTAPAPAVANLFHISVEDLEWSINSEGVCDVLTENGVEFTILEHRGTNDGPRRAGQPK